MAKASGLSAKQIALDLIDEPKGIIRLEIDPGRLHDLAKNINEVGLLQPIIVRPDGERFEIVFGHRRYLAHKILKARSIACMVRVLTDLECALMRGTENIQRDDLSPIEEAAIYSDLHTNHNLSYDEIGKRMSKSGGLIKRRLDLLRMPPQLQQAVHKREISFTVAEELWSIGDITGIDYYLALCIEHGAKRKVVRDWVKEWKDQKRRESSAGGVSGGVAPAMEPRPSYVACDLCMGPMEIGTETTLRVCPDCGKKIANAVKGG